VDQRKDKTVSHNAHFTHYYPLGKELAANIIKTLDLISLNMNMYAASDSMDNNVAKQIIVLA